ncbi:hypothetical protein MJO28_002340 [Puccinia striiformis f. sp. tritici]|uniref:Uncharacterized protein n=1 Tax=Puccinia striiformis f. sp. tritici TaxID=168172 RepID=A0ACC0EXL0_9BASI|nr:hypothetical protein MJO28_002340 [Puccinia striiformis f. sp. tritici]
MSASLMAMPRNIWPKSLRSWIFYALFMALLTCKATLVPGGSVDTFSVCLAGQKEAQSSSRSGTISLDSFQAPERHAFQNGETRDESSLEGMKKAQSYDLDGSQSQDDPHKIIQASRKRKNIMHEGIDQPRKKPNLPIDLNEKPAMRISFQNLMPERKRFDEHPLVGLYMDKYLQEYEKLPKHPRSITDGEQEDSALAGLPMVNYNGFFAPMDEMSGRRVVKYPAENRMKNLMNSLIFTNTVILKEVSPNLSPEDIDRSHHQLLGWLLKETFYPSFGMPVYGKAGPGRCKIQFGEVQANIMILLSKTVCPNFSLSTACSLALHFYDSFGPEISGILTGFGESNHLSLIEELIIKAVKARESLPKETSSSISGKIGGLSLLDIQGLPSCIIPDYYFHKAGEFGAISNNLVEKVKESYYYIPPSRQVRQKFGDLPILLVEEKSLKHKESIKKSLRIIIRPKSCTHKFGLMKKLNSLLTYLLNSHLIFVKHFIGKNEAMDGKSQLLKSSLLEFMKWFEDELLYPKSSLPVFGVFKDLDGSLERSRFGDIQILTIDYISLPGSHSLLPNLSIGLILYWYRLTNPLHYMQNFSNEEDFVKFMIDLLVKNKDQFKQLKKNDTQKRKACPGSTSQPNTKKAKS